MRKLTVREFATVKRVAQNVNPLVVKKNKLAAKIEELAAEKKSLEDQIAGHEAGIQAMTGGLMSEDLVTKVVEPTDKRDKDGNIIKVTKYLPTGLVTYNEEENCYYINEQEPEFNGYSSVESVVDTESETTAASTGADNDIDNLFND